MSDNPGMRWDIETTKRTIGYAPQDGAAPVLTETIEQDERSAHDMRRMAERLDAVSLMCISYDLIRRSVLAVRAVVSVDDGHAAMSFSFAKGSASIRV